MKKGKFWLSQIIMVAIVSLALSSHALADKPVEKKDNGKTTTTSNNGKGKGSGSGSDTTTTTTSGDVCPEGMVWLDLWGTCMIAY